MLKAMGYEKLRVRFARMILEEHVTVNGRGKGKPANSGRLSWD